MKKILIDARLYGIEHTGIGRYIQALLTYLPKSSDVEVVIVTHPSHADDQNLKRFKVIAAKLHPYNVFSQIEMLWILLRQRPDLIHIPHFTIPIFWPGAFVVTIHDLIKHESTGPATTTRHHFIYWLKYLLYLLSINVSINRSKSIIVPSVYWKNKIMEKFKVVESKIFVTYEGVDEIYKKLTVKRSLKYKLISPYILYVGNLYPHKNIETLIKAVVLLKGKVHLYISCARNVFWEKTMILINSYKAQDWIGLLGFVSDIDLVSIHKNALSFVTASKIEGLGLPGLEAMAAGNAVISSNTSCLPEIYGNAALYFDPDNPSELTEKIDLLLKDKSVRRKLVANGKIQVGKYDWGKMAQQTWEIYLANLN